MSELKVNKISPRSGTDVTLGDSGDAISVASGASLTSPGLTLSDNILFNAASKGIYLGVTTATASNLLDDYEEGTWTPAYSFASGSVTMSAPTGLYTKIGNMVFAKFIAQTSAISSPSGTASITGLPFTISNTTGAQPGGPISLAYRFAAGTSGYFFQLNGGTNTTSAFIYRTTPNVTTPILLQGSDFITGGNRNSLNALLIYQTD
jgi:hypothetical protein